MTFTGYWHFSSGFQTTRTLYFLWVGGGGYSKKSAYSWRGDTSIDEERSTSISLPGLIKS